MKHIIVVEDDTGIREIFDIIFSEIARAAMAAGADEFINKPFNIDHIRNRVDFYAGRAVPVGEGLLWG